MVGERVQNLLYVLWAIRLNVVHSIRIVSRRLFSRPVLATPDVVTLSVLILLENRDRTGFDFCAPGFVQITDLDGSILFLVRTMLVEEIFVTLSSYFVSFRRSSQILDRPCLFLACFGNLAEQTRGK